MSDAAPPTLDALTRALDDPDGEVRVAAVHALGRLDRAEAERALSYIRAQENVTAEEVQEDHD